VYNSHVARNAQPRAVAGSKRKQIPGCVARNTRKSETATGARRGVGHLFIEAKIGGSGIDLRLGAAGKRRAEQSDDADRGLFHDSPIAP
jgi:hypothetical protein